MATKILVVEDEAEFLNLLRFKLGAEGFQVLGAQDGVTGLKLVQEQDPDLVLLDVMMPRMNGWETCRRIREVSDVPIIILSAVGGDSSKVRGLELGADDYVTKPFSLMELTARIRAVLRRYTYPAVQQPVLKVDGRLIMDRPRRQIVVEGQRIKLSPIEYRLLNCFLDNIGRVLTHQSLLTQVWGWEYTDETDYLKVYIHHLRKKIEEKPHEPSYIVTERGLGYRFQIP